MAGVAAGAGAGAGAGGQAAGLVSLLDHLGQLQAKGSRELELLPTATDEGGAAAGDQGQLDSEGYRVLFVALGAVAGALLRWKIQSTVSSVDPKFTRYSTLGINAAGSLILGAVAGLGTTIASPITLAVGVGFCGSFTTFSTYAVDVVKLLSTQSSNGVGEGILLIVATNALCICSAALSFILTKKQI